MIKYTSKQKVKLFHHAPPIKHQYYSTSSIEVWYSSADGCCFVLKSFIHAISFTETSTCPFPPNSCTCTCVTARPTYIGFGYKVSSKIHFMIIPISHGSDIWRSSTNRMMVHAMLYFYLLKHVKMIIRHLQQNQIV